MAHDIYSIGVILLEIGLSMAFICRLECGSNDFMIDDAVLGGGKSQSSGA